MDDALATPPDVDACELEPIHIPGGIQPHGYLVVLNDRDFTVACVSQNVADVLGIPATALIGRPVGDLVACVTPDDLIAALGSRIGETALRVRFRTPAPSVEWEARSHQDAGLILLELGPQLPAGQAEPLFGQVHSGIERIRGSRSEDGACAALATEIRRLTGFDRVMIYRFDPAWNGEVVAEDKADHAHSYLGHSFPAGDIPQQARALYLCNTVRQIPDVAAPPSPLIPAIIPSTGLPIDLSRVTSRAVSPVHLEYLTNMGVSASMSVSIVRDGELWGLVACHHSSARLLPHRVLQGCELLAQAIAWFLETEERTAAARCMDELLGLETELAARRLASELSGQTDDDQDYRDRLAWIAPTLLGLTKSRGMAIWDARTLWARGTVPSDEAILALVEWLDRTGADRVTSDRLGELFQDRDLQADAAGIAARRLGNGWIIWFRPQWVHTLTWAGEQARSSPHRVAAGRINPRKSFESWQESVRGRSRPWTRADRFAVNQAERLISHAGMVDHARRALLHRKLEGLGQVAGSLAHKLNNLLQPIVGMAQMALEDHADDQELTEAFTVILDSSRRAAEVVSGTMHYIRRSRDELRPMRLVETVRSGLDVLRRTMPPGIQLDERIGVAEGWVFFQPGELSQIIRHLVGNAVAALGGCGNVMIAVDELSVDEAEAVRLSIGAGGYARLTVRDDGPGIPPKLLDRIFEPFFSTEDIGQGTGLGLPTIFGVVRSCGGTITARNLPAGGACFDVLLPLSDRADIPDRVIPPHGPLSAFGVSAARPEG